MGQGCYLNNVRTNIADTAFMVDPKWQGSGLGSAMQLRLMEHARGRSVQGFVADILPHNTKMIALARKGSEKVTVERDEGLGARDGDVLTTTRRVQARQGAGST